MKLKSAVNAMIIAVGLITSSSTLAGTFLWTGSVNDWSTAGAITTTDGDITFDYISNGGSFDAANTMVTLQELELNGQDYYDVGFSYSGLAGGTYAGGGDIRYSMTAHQILMTNVLFDTVKVGSGTGLTATKDLFDLSAGSPFLTLTSTDGSNTGYQYFDARNYIEVLDTFGIAANAAYQDSHNNFTLVPEPVSLSLFGIGLAALRFTRRAA